MNELVIHLPVEKYVSNDFGELCVQLGDYYFPDKGWTDFGQTAVFGWQSELTELFSKRSEKARCKFMDGNYRFDVELSESPERLNLIFIRERRDFDEIEHRAEVGSGQLFREVLRVVKAIRDECRKDSNFAAVDRIEESIRKFAEAKDVFDTASTG